MKLYDLPRDKGIKIIDLECSDGSTYVTFGHIDGMYSYCTTEKDNVVHLSAGTELEKVGNNYKVKE